MRNRATKALQSLAPAFYNSRLNVAKEGGHDTTTPQAEKQRHSVTRSSREAETVPRRKMTYPLSWLIMLRNYLRETGRKCITYRGLRAWIFRKPEYKDIEWHTVERAMRRLAEDGWLERIELGGRKVAFCPKRDLEKAAEEIMTKISGARKTWRTG